jgi:hypothetical protein
MRLFYKYTDEKHIEFIPNADGKSEIQKKIPVADVEVLVDSGEAVIYDTLNELRAVIQYSSDRRDNYPAIEGQLDQIYHEGIDAWKETIQAVKDAHPKP